MKALIVVLICCSIVAARKCKESAANIWSKDDSCVSLIQVTKAGTSQDYEYKLLYRLRGGLGCSWGPKDFQVPHDCGFGLEVGRSYIVGFDYYFNFVRLYD